MASTLRASLSFERVVEQALDVCSLALEDMGVPQEALVGAIFLYEGQDLVPLARRRFLGGRRRKNIGRQRRYGGQRRCARRSRRLPTTRARNPELKEFDTFANALTVVCIPLRAGYQLFGVMVFGQRYGRAL